MVATCIPSKSASKNVSTVVVLDEDEDADWEMVEQQGTAIDGEYVVVLKPCVAFAREVN